MLTMCPPSRSCGRQSRVIRISPSTFVSRTTRSSSSVLASKESRPSASPAPLTRMSRPSTIASETKRSQLAGSVTSSSCPSTGDSIKSARRAPPITRAPSRASARAVAAPMPLEAPVTTATFPFRPGIAADSNAAADLARTTARQDEVESRDLFRKEAALSAAAWATRQIPRAAEDVHVAAHDAFEAGFVGYVTHGLGVDELYPHSSHQKTPHKFLKEKGTRFRSPFGPSFFDSPRGS